MTLPIPIIVADEVIAAVDADLEEIQTFPVTKKHFANTIVFMVIQPNNASDSKLSWLNDNKINLSDRTSPVNRCYNIQVINLRIYLNALAS